jgi:AcrR family transcriptional regulator
LARKRTIDNDGLLKTAREVFLEGGAFGSTREIARRARISEATLFKRYPTKTALFLAAMAPPHADIDFIMAQVHAQTDPRKALHVLAHQVLGYFRMAIPRMLPLITHPAIGLEAMLQQFGVSPADKLTEAIAAYLSEQKKRGVLATESPHAAAAVINASLHSVALFELMGIHGGEVPASAVRNMMDALWHGLEPKKTGRRKA